MSEDEKIGSVLRIRVPSVQVQGDLLVSETPAAPPLTLLSLEEITRGAVRMMVEREARELLQPNPLLDYLPRNMPPPQPWWRRWNNEISWRLGTRLIRWGRALGGDDED